MIDRGEGPKPGGRDNGLRATRYAAVGDLDPRVAEAMLDRLLFEGIAAYVVPTPSDRGGYLEMRPTSNVTDRLYVDETRLTDASGLVAAEHVEVTPTSTEALELDDAWQQVLSSLRSSPSDAERPWPAAEDVPRGGDAPSMMDFSPYDYGDTETSVGTDPAQEDHFVPPAAPPLPALRPVTLGSLAAIIVGIVIVVTGLAGGSLEWLGIVAIIGGAVSLVWHVKEGPPEDSGWDDGAVV